MSNKEYLGQVLVVDDDPDIRNILEASLVDAGFSATVAEDIPSLRAALIQRSYDAILLDLFLGDDDSLSVLPHIVQKYPYTKVIMMSAQGTVEFAVDALQKGASTFISKSKNSTEIVEELKKRLHRDPEQELGNTLAEHGIIGDSPAIQQTLSQIDRIKDVDSTVLVVGESGTGKELVARAIHNASKRATRRFEAINCGAIPGNLLESELFGHKRGAFTDAKADRKGIFQMCEGGSLLLDEIGEMPMELQVKLLRVLQEREIQPLGAGRSIPVDVRVIAATNRNPLDEVRAGAFREDLYYRLAVITIELPPLRDRKSDIPQLVNHFLMKMRDRFQKQMANPSRELEARLMAYDWPGNIRELQNAVERGVILSKDGEMHIEDMFSSLDHKLDRPKDGKQVVLDEKMFAKPLSDAKQDFEKEYLRQLLEVTRGNIAEIARISHRYRADIYRLLSKHGLEWEEFRS